MSKWLFVVVGLFIIVSSIGAYYFVYKPNNFQPKTIFKPLSFSNQQKQDSAINTPDNGNQDSFSLNAEVISEIMVGYEREVYIFALLEGDPYRNQIKIVFTFDQEGQIFVSYINPVDKEITDGVEFVDQQKFFSLIKKGTKIRVNTLLGQGDEYDVQRTNKDIITSISKGDWSKLDGKGFVIYASSFSIFEQ